MLCRLWFCTGLLPHVCLFLHQLDKLRHLPRQRSAAARVFCCRTGLQHVSDHQTLCRQRIDMGGSGSWATVRCQPLKNMSECTTFILQVKEQTSYRAGYDGGLLKAAVDLGDRFMPAFDTPTRIPLSWVNLRRVRSCVARASHAARGLRPSIDASDAAGVVLPPCPHRRSALLLQVVHHHSATWMSGQSRVDGHSSGVLLLNLHSIGGTYQPRYYPSCRLRTNACPAV